MKLDRIQIMDIEVGDRLRTVDSAKVAALRSSIESIGLQTPPTVALLLDGEGNTHYRLIAGAHRLAALRLIQPEDDFTEVFIMEGSDDDVALWEIDENFARAELTDAQRADHHVRRETILVRKGLAARPGRGGDRSNGQNVRSYAKQTSEALGVDERTVRRDLARGKSITPDVLAQVAGTPLDKGVVLDELARTPASEQRAKLVEIAARPPSTKTRELDEAWAQSGPSARSLFLDAIDAPKAPTLRELLVLFYRQHPEEIAPHGNDPDASADAAADATLSDAVARGGALAPMASLFAEDDRPAAKAIARLLARVSLA